MTSRVDFYLLKAMVPDGRLRVACRLIQKIYNLGHTAYIHISDEKQIQRIDDLLWTFDQGSFIPHVLSGQNQDQESMTPILIGNGPPPHQNHDVLVTLSNDVVNYYLDYQRVAEIVDFNEQDRSLARQRYKFYRDNGCQLSSHDISP